MALKRVWAVLVLALFSTGCAAERVVRLDTGMGPARDYRPRTEAPLVVLDGAGFQEAVRTLARGMTVDAAPRDVARELLGHREYARVRGRLGLVSVEAPGRGRLSVQEVGSELEGAYGRWCLRKRLVRDCLHLLDEGVTLDAEGKRTLAFRLALESVWDETAEALGELTDREAMVTMLATTGAFYLGLWLVPEPLLSKVEAVAVSSAGTVTLSLAPGAVAMVAQAAASGPVETEGPEHPIATNKNSESDVRGGPWTPRFQEIFDRAGMSLEDPMNKVRVPGHKGPHPREYHEKVFTRLSDATKDASSMEQCRAALTSALRRLARELVTAGSELNKLITKGE